MNNSTHLETLRNSYWLAFGVSTSIALTSVSSLLRSSSVQATLVDWMAILVMGAVSGAFFVRAVEARQRLKVARVVERRLGR